MTQRTEHEKKQHEEGVKAMTRIFNRESRGIVIVTEISPASTEGTKHISAGVMYVDVQDATKVEFIETMIGAIQNELGIDRLALIEWIAHTYRNQASTYSRFPKPQHGDIGLSDASK